MIQSLLQQMYTAPHQVRGKVSISQYSGTGSTNCCSLGCQIKGSYCALVLDNTQLPYLEAYNALFYNALLQTVHLFMCAIIVQTLILTLQESVFNVHHLVHPPRECLTVDNMSVANVSHSASMTHVHACIILLLILIHSMPHTMLYR